ncbi:MAG: antibiotic biosynthesis monooxygenase [Gemmatimonadaceae bacterium]
MAFISLTRLRLRSLRFFPMFAIHTFASTRQLRRAPGFVRGRFALEGLTGFWTITAWKDDASMRAYRNTDAHKRAMPKLMVWCDEASVAHFEQPGDELLTAAQALERMIASGRISKVRHPSPGHAAGMIAPDRKVPQVRQEVGPD